MTYKGFKTPDELVTAYERAQQAAFNPESYPVPDAAFAEFNRLNCIYCKMHQMGPDIFKKGNPNSDEYRGKK